MHRQSCCTTDCKDHLRFVCLFVCFKILSCGNEPRTNNDAVVAKLDALLAASAKANDTVSTMSVYDKALYPPEDPDEVWKFNFELVNKIPNDYFVEWFSAEYIPCDNSGRPVYLTNTERQTLISLVDAYPADGRFRTVHVLLFCVCVCFACKGSNCSLLRSMPRRPGLISLAEFKRFCRQVARSKMTMYHFLNSLSVTY